MLGFLKRRRRSRLLETPVTPEWREILRAQVPHYGRLSADEQSRIEGLVRIFLAEKSFEGCGGLVIDDEKRLTVAGLACLLLLNRETDVYPKLHSILIYPEAFAADIVEEDEDGLVHEAVEERLGESWERGSLVLSWADVTRDLAAHGEGFNVVLHEFAHQLDDEHGVADGMPALPNATAEERWKEVCGREFAVLQRRVEHGRSKLFDDYAAESPTEFFAAAVELFFEAPRLLLARHAELYGVLKDYFRQDPAVWPERLRE